MKLPLITLFGDSIIDNGVYVGSEELSVLQHLNHRRPDKLFEQRAVDGDTTKDVLSSQLIDSHTGKSVLSIGGQRPATEHAPDCDRGKGNASGIFRKPRWSR